MNDNDQPIGAPAHSSLLTRRRLLTLAGGGLVLAACSSSKGSGETAASAASTPASVPTSRATTSAAPTSTSTSTSTSTTSTTLAPTTTLPPPVQPLTGLPLTDPALLAAPALVVKVSNDPGARPQTGLNQADIIFEAWGAGPTRFATVWHSQDADFVGPIRSCREQDVNLVGSFNGALFACSGGNPGNINLIRDSDLLLITEGRGPGWELDPRRSRPHKTHANTAELRTNAGPDRSGPPEQYHYRAVGEAATAGEAMTGFDLQMQQVSISWRYDPATGTYLRSQSGRPHMMTTGDQVSTDNVIIAWTDYQRSSTDARSPNGDTTGTNPLHVFTGGRMITGTWTRNDRLEPFAWNDDNGQPIPLTPGRTFIELANGGQGSFPGNDEFTPVP